MCVGAAVAVILHRFLVLAGLSPLLPCVVLHAWAVPSQLPSVACTCRRYNHSPLALLVCVVSAVAITFSLPASGAIIRVASLRCFHVSAVPSQLPGTWLTFVGTTIRAASLHRCRVLAVQPQSSPCIACVCWQCHPSTFVHGLHVCKSCLLAWLACVGTIIAVISLHRLLVLVGLSQLLLCIACVCQWSHLSCLLAWLTCAGTIVTAASIACVNQQCSFDHLLPWLECIGSITRAASTCCLCALAVHLQLPPCMACMCCCYNRSHLLALLVCGGSAFPVAFSYSLHALALQSQSPPCVVSVLAVQPDSPFSVA